MDMNDVKALIDALRNGGSVDGVDVKTGPNPGMRAGNPLASPIGKRRDGYRLYLREIQAGTQPGPAKSYEEWLGTQDPNASGM